MYDSFDDEEESDEEDLNICYLEPDNIFLYILDTLTLISSFIILFYLPIYLAKRLFFCSKLLDINTFAFYFIDFLYILDLIFNCYRAYYNFDEILVKKYIKIFIHYLKTWLFLDLICSFPVYTILTNYENKCFSGNHYYDYKLVNNGNHSHLYNINLNNMHYFFLLLKVIKTFKIFKNNIAFKKLKKTFYQIDFLNNWGNVLLYALFFFSFLNFLTCFYIFLGRNIDDSWIFANDLEEKNFMDIYTASIYYLVMTVTTVGYGDLLGKSLIEIIFQIIMVIVGTCIYSWLISFVSNYVQKMSEKDEKYQEKLQVLEEIKLNNHIDEKLYNKILRLLNYRKYKEEETEKNVILESLPNSLKNTLLIEMYKTYIDGFSFFKDIENREFIVKIISKLNPIIGIKGDIIIEEGESIEEIIFIKNGVLSLEVWIEMSCPEESIKNYLFENGFINNKRSQILNESSTKSFKNSTISITKPHNLNTTFNHYFEKMDIKNEKALNENKKILKVLDIRKNEHFGDVQMFLNKKSPFYIRVNSRIADLLFLKKLDAINISDRYPDIWKNVIKKPLENSKIISNLTLKTLAMFCNLNGIKTQLFKKKNKNKNYPKYYLNPIINKLESPRKKRTNKTSLNYSEENDIQRIGHHKSLEFKKKNIKNFEFDEDLEENKKNFSKISGFENSSFSFYNKNDDKIKSGEHIGKNKEKKEKISIPNKTKNCYKIIISNMEEKNNNNLINNNKISINKDNSNNNSIINNTNFSTNKDNSSLINNSKVTISKGNNNDNLINKSKIIDNKNNSNNNNLIDNSNLSINKDNNNNLIDNSNLSINKDKNNNNLINKSKISDNNNNSNNKSLINKSKISVNKDENNIKEKENNINKNIESDSNYDFIVNDEIHSDESFNIKIYDDEKSKANNNIKIIPDNIYINNLNINYMGTPPEKKEENPKQIDKKIFSNLKIFSCSTLEIDSSYENINEITNNKYINYYEFRKETKDFLIEKATQYDNKMNFSKYIFKSKITNKFFGAKYSSGIYKSSFGDKNFLLNKNRSFDIKEKNIRKASTKKCNNIFTNESLNNFNNIFRNNNNRIIKRNSSTSCDINELKPIEDINENNDNNFYFKRKKFMTKSNDNNLKKKKKLKELDIISFNIQKTSQNLNQPSEFYAGLFNNLISKDYPKLNLSPNIFKSKQTINSVLEISENKKNELIK